MNKDQSSMSPTTAADLMSSNLVSIHGGASVEEVISFLMDSGFSAAPVIDDSGRPIGVVSRTDVVVYDRARVPTATDPTDYFDQADLSAGSRIPSGDKAIRAADLMTPAIFSVAPDTPVLDVARQMAELNVHRLFVVDKNGVLVGVLSALDLLRHLAGPRPE